LGGIVRDGSSVTREEVLERLDLRSGFLDLRGLGLKDIPDLCKLLQVDEAMAVLAVDLSSNSLERVDISLECMQFLQEVDLSFNTISEFVTL
jgi:Leucine-rich repeat (LRR) protein